MYERQIAYNNSPAWHHFEKDLIDATHELQYRGLHDFVDMAFLGVDLADNVVSLDARQILADIDYCTLDGQLKASSFAGNIPNVDALKLRFNPYRHIEYIDADLIARSQNGPLNDVQFTLSSSKNKEFFGITYMPNLLTAIDDLHQKKEHYYPSLVDPRETEQISLAQASLWLFECLMPTSKEKSTKHVFVNNEPIVSSLAGSSANDGSIFELQSMLTVGRINSTKINYITFELSTMHNLLSGDVSESRQFILNLNTGQMRIITSQESHSQAIIPTKYNEDDLIAAFSANLANLLTYKLGLADNSSA